MHAYQVKEELGAGCFGCVYRATRGTGQAVAIKCVPLKHYNAMHARTTFPFLDASYMERPHGISTKAFEREELLHRHFAAHGVGPDLLDSGIEEPVGVGYLVFALWDRALTLNDTLSHQLRDKLKKQLHTLHALGYVHLDLRTDNVLVRVHPVETEKLVDVTLTDFGMARALACMANNGVFKELCRIYGCDRNKPTELDWAMFQSGILIGSSPETSKV